MEVERKDRNEDVVVPRIGSKIRTPPSMEFIVKNPYACDVIMRYLMDTIFYNDFVFIMRVLSAFDDEKNENNVQALKEIEDRINLLNDFLDVNSPLKLSLVVEDFQGLETFVQMFQDKQTIHLIIGMYNLISHRFQRDILPTFFQQNQVEYFKSLTKYCRISIKQYQRRVRKTEKLCTAYRSAARKTLKKSKIPIHVLTKYTSSATPMNNKKGGAKEVRREDLDGHVAMSVMESSFSDPNRKKGFSSPQSLNAVQDLVDTQVETDHDKIGQDGSQIAPPPSGLPPTIQQKLKALIETLWECYASKMDAELNSEQLKSLLDDHITSSKVPYEECQRFIQCMDLDGNESISKEEFETFVSKGLFMDDEQIQVYRKRSDMHIHLVEFLGRIEEQVTAQEISEETSISFNGKDEKKIIDTTRLGGRVFLGGSFNNSHNNIINSINYDNLDHIISLSRSSTPSSTKSSTQQSKSFLSPTKSSKNMRKLQMNININNKKKNALSNSSNLYRREQQWNSSLK